MLNKIKNIIFKIIYVLVIIYLIIFIPIIWGYKPLVIVSGSMEPILKVGGILYYKNIPLNDYKKDDILVYRIPDHNVSHRIVEINNNSFLTKGDVNEYLDNPVYHNQILGKGTNFSIPLIGYYANFIYNHKYLLYISIFVVVIDYCCYAIKKNDEDN
jgi:signal peptidase